MGDHRVLFVFKLEVLFLQLKAWLVLPTFQLPIPQLLQLPHRLLGSIVNAYPIVIPSSAVKRLFSSQPVSTTSASLLANSWGDETNL
jgi:hypothetical protein